MDIKELRSMHIALLDMQERLTYLMHQMHKLEEETQPEPRRLLTRAVELHVVEQRVKKPIGRPRKSPSSPKPLTARIYSIIISRLKKGPARWMDLQALAEENGYKGKYAVTGAMKHLRERGIVTQPTYGVYELVESKLNEVRLEEK